MKVIEGLCYAFDTEMIPPKIHEFLKEKLEILGAESFSNTMLYWFGGRGYNQFLDYHLLAIKLSDFFEKKYFPVFNKEGYDFHEIVSEGLVLNLLFDDRHDMYQNVLYELNELYPKLSPEEQNGFWESIAKFIIESFNPNGKDSVIDFSYRD